MRRRAGLLAVLTFVLTVSLAAHAEGPVDRRLVQALRLTPFAATPPALALQRLEDGRTVGLEQFRGRPVLLYFWATW
jgi:cytochrome oxidase Cu insertion factor (SCO1/SenC/PrrC family)